MTTTPIDTLITQLQHRLSELGNGHDCKSDNERADYRAAHDETQRCLTGLCNLPADVARRQSQINEVTTRRADVVAKQAEIEQQLAAILDPQDLRDRRERDRQLDQQQHLVQQLTLLRDGRLLRAPGVAYERLVDLDARLAELTTRRDAAQHALDAHVKTAEALLAAVPVTT